MRTLFLVASLLIGGTVSAQQASYTYNNQPRPYSNPPSRLLVALNTPRIGTTFQVQVPMSTWSTGFWGGYCQSWSEDYYLLTGATNPAVNLGFGVLLSSSEVVIASPIGFGGHNTVSFAVPMSSSLIGVSFYQQVVQVSQGFWNCSWYSFITLSRGGHGVIGT